MVQFQLLMQPVRIVEQLKQQLMRLLQELVDIAHEQNGKKMIMEISLENLSYHYLLEL